MVSLETFSELLGVLYSAPLHPERWERFLDLLCEHTQSRSSLLICADSRQSLSVQAQGGVHQSPVAVSDYSAMGAARDPFMLPLIRSAKLGVMDCEKLVPRKVLEESEMYRQVHYPSGSRYPGLVALSCSLRRLEVLSFWRSEEAGYLDADSVTLMQLLVPHLQSAMEMRQTLGAARSRAMGAEAIANASATPTFLLASNSAILHTNAAGRKLLQDGDGLILTNGMLQAAKDSMKRPLRELLSRTDASAANFMGFNAAKPLALERPSGRKSLQLLAAPSPEHGAGGVLLLVTDPEKSVAIPDDALKAHYNFTEAEAEVANGLLTGYSLDEISAFRNVKIGTVRDQVKSMLSKTGTSKQVELVRLLLTLPRMG